MARLHLVRHAQASFGLDNYDQLSDVGFEQSTFIPKHFEQTPQVFYRGDMKRHEQTLSHSFSKVPFKIMPGLNEFDHVDVLQVHRPEIADKEKAVALVMGQADPKKFMEVEFKAAMLKWMNEEGTSSYKESFKAFEQRAQEAIATIIETARKEQQKDIVAVTSGGFIALAMMHLLQLPKEKMIELNLGVANTSVTSLLFNNEKISLSYFNNFSHLPSAMVTYR